jgi:isopentenyl-diphosphate Delta-isomerase
MVLLVTSQNRIPLQLRSRSKSDYPLCWTGTAAGTIEPGEQPLEAAQRELQEEAGVTAPLGFVATYTVKDEIAHNAVHLFFGRSDGPFRFGSRETEEFKLFDVEDLRQRGDALRVTPHLHQAIALVLKKFY